ncbi:MAG: sensor histidine kinase [Huintestinicola sp.]
MKKISIDIIFRLTVIILAAAALITACVSSNQSTTAILLPVSFEGEYSFDGGSEWAALTDQTELSALDGDIILRGNFDVELPEGLNLNIFLDHITMEIFINGEQVFWDSRTEMGLTSSNCCKQWTDWRSPGISKNDVVEIYLANPHKFGNKNAYSEFLGSIYIGHKDIFEKQLMKTGQLERTIGFSVMVAAVMLLAVSMAFRLLKIDGGRTLGNLGFLAMFFGGYFVLDTADLSLWSELNAFNTYGLQICIMLSSFFGAVCIAESTKSKAAKAARAAAAASAAVNSVLCLLSLLGVTVIYDTGIYWLAAHAVIFTVLLCCSGYELFCGGKKDIFAVFSNALFSASILADMVNFFTELLPVGICSKTVFLILFLLNLIKLIKDIPAGYLAARQAEKLKAELAENRISIMLSQIQPHFLYNVLNTIYYLCDKDKETAQEAISEFSDYLRRNMDSLTASAPIPFFMELKHLQSYLNLEKLRFGDDLNIEWDIRVEGFTIPALTVQPIAENAVKHGICRSEDGGTVKISSRETEDSFEVEVWDSGPGFDVNKAVSHYNSHVGIRNVRERLMRMCGGTLDITSGSGTGTSAVIRIPKAKKTGDNA